MKVVFLDRDGVINTFPGNGNYVTKVKDFHFLPRALDAIKLLTDEGYTIFVVSNQAGVGRGVYSQDKLNRINKKMMQGVGKAGGKIKKAFYCTHRPDVGCSCRKPDIGNILKALKSIGGEITPAKRPYFIGDTKSDMETGYNSGCRTIFVLSGRENRRYMRGWIVKPDFIAKNLFEATQFILGHKEPFSKKRRNNNSKS